MLGRRIAARPRPPATVRDLEVALLEEWNSIPQSLIDNLIASMANSHGQVTRTTLEMSHPTLQTTKPYQWKKLVTSTRLIFRSNRTETRDSTNAGHKIETMATRLLWPSVDGHCWPSLLSKIPWSVAYSPCVASQCNDNKIINQQRIYNTKVDKYFCDKRTTHLLFYGYLILNKLY
ncbi:hypothetical protein TNCV_1897491 [Trichonephila clavipes]|nr:hypothetical protein TNCV_1897491 [Trichonephila clavipes]